MDSVVMKKFPLFAGKEEISEKEIPKPQNRKKSTSIFPFFVLGLITIIVLV